MKCTKFNSNDVKFQNVSTIDTSTKKGKGCLWWLLMLCICPIALSIWFYKTDKFKLDKKWKIVIIVVFWGFIIGNTSEDTTTESIDTIVVDSTIEETKDSSVEDETEADEPMVSFNEEFINTYVPLGIATIMQEYKKLEEVGDYEVIRELMYRKHQPDSSIPVLEEQIVSGKGLIIGTNTYAGDSGTTLAELYIGNYDFDYSSGIIPATEKLLAEHPEEWCNFVSITSGEYMKVNRGDIVYFEGTIYGISNNIMHLKGTCYIE